VENYTFNAKSFIRNSIVNTNIKLFEVN